MFQVNPLLDQALFSSKDISKTLKCHLLQFLFGALRVLTEVFFYKCSLYLCGEMGKIQKQHLETSLIWHFVNFQRVRSKVPSRQSEIK